MEIERPRTPLGALLLALDRALLDRTRFTSFREIAEHYAGLLPRRSAGPPLRQQVEARLVAAAAATGREGVPVAPDTYLADLFGGLGAEGRWRRFREEVELPLPPLRRPSPLVTAAALAVLVSFCVAIFRTEMDGAAWTLFVYPLVTSVAVVLLTRPFRTVFPEPTISLLVDRVMAEHPGEFLPEDEGWTPDQVLEVVRANARILDMEEAEVARPENGAEEGRYHDEPEEEP